MDPQPSLGEPIQMNNTPPRSWSRSERPNGWTDEDEQNCINEAETILAELYASGEMVVRHPDWMTAEEIAEWQGA
jgi:hypothetical protein